MIHTVAMVYDDTNTKPWQDSVMDFSSIHFSDNYCCDFRRHNKSFKTLIMRNIAYLICGVVNT